MDKKSRKKAKFKVATETSPKKAGAVGFDVVLKNINALVGGAFKKRDIGIVSNLISFIGEPGSLESGARIIPGEDLYVSPGWVDIHVHLVDSRYGKSSGAPVSRLGLQHGVTALVDTGTVGAANFDMFEQVRTDNPDIPCFSFLNIKREGIRFSDFSSNEVGWDDIPAMEAAIENHREHILGIKVRADKILSPKSDPMYYVRKTREAGDILGMPVMAHIGDPPLTIAEILPLLKENDILTHCFRGQGNSIINARGKIRDDVKEACKRGVRFDVGHGVSSFSFDDAEKALGEGFSDFTISTDLHIVSARFCARTFANVLTNFLAVGLPLEQIMERASIGPAKILRLQRVIAPGAEATLTIFSCADGEFTCTDSVGITRKCAKRIIPEWTIIKGKIIRAGELDRKLFLTGTKN